MNTVAVTVNPTDSELKTYSDMNFTHLQLHGNESLNDVRKINETYNLKIIKAFTNLNLEEMHGRENIFSGSQILSKVLLHSQTRRQANIMLNFN